MLINISGMLTDSSAARVHFPSRVYPDPSIQAFNRLAVVRGSTAARRSRLDRPLHFYHRRTGHRHDWLRDPDLRPDMAAYAAAYRAGRVAEYGPADSSGAWTTVGNWRGYGSIRHQGVAVWSESALVATVHRPAGTDACPSSTGVGHPSRRGRDLEAPRAQRMGSGRPCDGCEHAGQLPQFHPAIERGELGIAKAGIVESQCGWFSDRSLWLSGFRDVPWSRRKRDSHGFCRLAKACWRSALIDDLVDAIESVNADYTRHCRRARQIAEARTSKRTSVLRPSSRTCRCSQRPQ